MSGLQRHDQASADNDDWLHAALHDGEFQLDRLLKSVEKKAIETALREHGGNVSKAAAMLGINRTTLYGRMDRLDDRE